MSIIPHTDMSYRLVPQEEEKKEVGDLHVGDVTPLNIAVHVETVDSVPGIPIPVQVQQNIYCIRFGEEFGVHFQGCQNIAMELLMKIDGKRLNNIEESEQWYL